MAEPLVDFSPFRAVSFELSLGLPAEAEAVVQLMPKDYWRVIFWFFFTCFFRVLPYLDLSVFNPRFRQEAGTQYALLARVEAFLLTPPVCSLPSSLVTSPSNLAAGSS